MKCFLIIIVFVGIVFCDERSAVEDLAEWTLEEISRRESDDLSLERLVGYTQKKNYNSAKAGYVTRISMEMEADRRGGELVECQADVDVPEFSASMSIKRYGCKGAAYQRRSGETPCSPDEMNVGNEAIKLMNQEVNEFNNEMGSLGMEEQPGLQSGEYSKPQVQTCSNVETADGVEYKLKMTAMQDSQTMNCDIVIIQAVGGSYQLNQNQCQGMS
uniref:uncharacterized protein LOC100175468 isoform X2 n=1 Tax=Ciona intestinalis TaxID=7719 RepID=UPI000EF487AE|nr:uncharacterized protein LOC100175468 isoform X2 [Ciona intestinalis]|eukprot:XP_026694633.1 uncharacterized protein LOC100175468 isoform X2 [Ciona intestinalis]